MRKKLLFYMICVLIIPVQGMCQKKIGVDSTFSPRLVIGSSLTYIWDAELNHFKEYTWATNVAVSPFKHLYVGVNYLRIWNSSDISAPKRFQLLGAFSQYHFGNNRRIYFTPELGFYRGDYCTCGPNIPYRRRGINYVAGGAGFGLKLYKALELDLSFLFYKPLLSRSGLNYAYNYTQYVIGLNYNFQLRGLGRRGNKEGREAKVGTMSSPE
jgi:hypothetical protein